MPEFLEFLEFPRFPGFPDGLPEFPDCSNMKRITLVVFVGQQRYQAGNRAFRNIPSWWVSPGGDRLGVRNYLGDRRVSKDG